MKKLCIFIFIVIFTLSIHTTAETIESKKILVGRQTFNSIVDYIEKKGTEPQIKDYKQISLVDTVDTTSCDFRSHKGKEEGCIYAYIYSDKTNSLIYSFLISEKQLVLMRDDSAKDISKAIKFYKALLKLI